MRFTKMHGCGNDYIYLDGFTQSVPDDPAALSRYLSREHFGIGADGIILILPCEGADARMRIFNKDGSEGEMCGNGIRCVGKFLCDSGIARKDVLNIQTGGGLKILEMRFDGGKAIGARVDMGQPRFEPEAIPVNAGSNRIKLDFEEKPVEFFCLNMGNPHAVTLSYSPTAADFARAGGFFENHPAFPARANISFCRVINRTHLETRIWERGSGPTLACGTGATATMVAAYMQGKVDSGAYVKLPGGELFIEYDVSSGHAFMTGPAETVFTGEFDISQLKYKE